MQNDQQDETGGAVTPTVDLVAALVEALHACIFLIEAANACDVDGYRAGRDDVELLPRGKYKLSQARAALVKGNAFLIDAIEVPQQSDRTDTPT